MMTATTNPMASPRPLLESNPLKPVPEDHQKSLVGGSSLTKEAKQRYIINEIKKLLQDCEDFIGLVQGENGVPEILVSPNLNTHDKWVIIGDAHGTFIQYLNHRKFSLHGKSGATMGQCSKVHKQEYPSSESKLATGSISFPFHRPIKRHRARAGNSRTVSAPKAHQNDRRTRLACEVPASQIRVDDSEKMAQWYQEAFLTLQQVACRLVAKVWIKKIHPKKQSTHPYNGQMPRGEPADPDRTRPPYWPRDVIHREPDHIGREERTRLLVHLITRTPQAVITNPPSDPLHQQRVTARQLSECLETKRSELREDRWEIIQQIIKAREMQEQYEDGEIDGDTLVFLNDYSDGSRLTPNESEGEVLVQEGPAPAATSDISDAMTDGLGEEPDLTPTSSTRMSPTDVVRREGSLQFNRLRGAEVGDGVNGRRLLNRRARPAMSGNRPPSTTIAPRTAQDFVSNLAVSLPNDAVSDATMHDSNTVVTQSHTGPLMMVRMPNQVHLNHFNHEADGHSGHGEMMHLLPHSNVRQSSLNYPPWTGMISDVAAEPPEHIFSIHPHMATQAQDLGNPYFPAIQHDTRTGIPAGLSVVSPVQYHNFTDDTRRHLPLRVLDTQHAGMMNLQDVNMDMMSAPFYGM